MDSEYYRDMDYWCFDEEPPIWMLYEPDDDQLIEEYANAEDDSVVEGEWWTRWEGARPRANEDA